MNHEEKRGPSVRLPAIPGTQRNIDNRRRRLRVAGAWQAGIDLNKLIDDLLYGNILSISSAHYIHCSPLPIRSLVLVLCEARSAVRRMDMQIGFRGDGCILASDSSVRGNDPIGERCITFVLPAMTRKVIQITECRWMPRVALCQCTISYILFVDLDIRTRAMIALKGYIVAARELIKRFLRSHVHSGL